MVKQGATVLPRYDPVGRLVRTDHPDGRLTRIEFDPWQQIAWDANDTVLDSAWYAQRSSAAWLSASHATHRAEFASLPGVGERLNSW